MHKLHNCVNFTKFLHFGGSCNNDVLLIQTKFGMRQYTHGLCCHVKFNLNVVILLASGGQNSILDKF